VAVVVLTLDYGRLPWIALVLAASFGTYGLGQEDRAGRLRGEHDHRDPGAAAAARFGYLLYLEQQGRPPSGARVRATRCSWSERV